MVCEKTWSQHSLERLYLFFYKRGGSIHILGLLQHFLWVRLRILVKWTRWALKFETIHELVVCKLNEIFSFLVTKVTWYFCFSQEVNSVRGHELSLLVLTTCLRGDETLVSAGDDCSVLVACKYNKIFLFFSYKG